MDGGGGGGHGKGMEREIVGCGHQIVELQCNVCPTHTSFGRISSH